MKIILKIKSLLSPTPISHPFSAKTVVNAIEEVPDNLRYTGSGKAYVQTDTDTGFVAEAWTGQTGQRIGQMTKADFDILKDRRLKETKYRKLKPFWASNYSARRAAIELRSNRGFSQRTIEKYYSAMNAAASPLPVE